MNAAQELLDFVRSSFTETGRRHIQDLLDQVEAEHAHKLAEQQRQWIFDRSDMPWWAGEIPDLIDPELEND